MKREKGSTFQSSSFVRKGLSEDVHDQIKVYGSHNKGQTTFTLQSDTYHSRYRFDVNCEARKCFGLILLNDRAEESRREKAAGGKSVGALRVKLKQ